jgi:hypothetical protein
MVPGHVQHSGPAEASFPASPQSGAPLSHEHAGSGLSKDDETERVAIQRDKVEHRGTAFKALREDLVTECAEPFRCLLCDDDLGRSVLPHTQQDAKGQSRSSGVVLAPLPARPLRRVLEHDPQLGQLVAQVIGSGEIAPDPRFLASRDELGDG